MVDHGSLHPEYEKKIIIEECERISIDYKDFIAPAWQIQRMNSEFKNSKKIIVPSDSAKKSMINLGIEEKKINILNYAVDNILFESKKIKNLINLQLCFVVLLAQEKVYII